MWMARLSAIRSSCRESGSSAAGSFKMPAGVVTAGPPPDADTDGRQAMVRRVEVRRLEQLLAWLADVGDSLGAGQVRQHQVDVRVVLVFALEHPQDLHPGGEADQTGPRG
jgi:hypothetical protein